MSPLTTPTSNVPFTLFLFFMLLGSVLHSQSNADELQLMQSLYGMEKRDIVSAVDVDNLRDSYFKKIKSRTDPVVAMQFYQIESYLSDLIRIELLEEVYTSKRTN